MIDDSLISRYFKIWFKDNYESVLYDRTIDQIQQAYVAGWNGATAWDKFVNDEEEHSISWANTCAECGDEFTAVDLKICYYQGKDKAFHFDCCPYHQPEKHLTIAK